MGLASQVPNGLEEIYATCGYAGGEVLALIFHELLSRDHEDVRATWQPQGVGFRT